MMRRLLALLSLFLISAAEAEPMSFQNIRNGGNCFNCAYIQATGEITPDTPVALEAFLASGSVHLNYVRLNSPGGSLIGGLQLGELFRKHGLVTEVGSSAPLNDAIEKGLYDRAPGVCVSACATPFSVAMSDFSTPTRSSDFIDFTIRQLWKDQV